MQSMHCATFNTYTQILLEWVFRKWTLSLGCATLNSITMPLWTLGSTGDKYLQEGQRKSNSVTLQKERSSVCYCSTSIHSVQINPDLQDK